MRSAKPLTSVAVVKLTEPGRYAVGDGAYLQISGQGTKAWVFRYTRDGKARHMGLGPFGLVSLAEAREKAREARRALLNGTDPLEAKRDRRAAARLHEAKALTFRACAERLIASHEAAWRDPKHRAQWRATLATYADPVFGDLPVASVDTGLVLRALEPIWTTKPETASRVRGRIEASSTGPRRAATARGRTRPGGVGTSTSSYRAAARFAGSATTRQCPTQTCRSL
jgi:hypothetical protein